MVMIEWFTSGKIYKKKFRENGHNQVGYFSIVFSASSDAKSSEVMQGIYDSVCDTYKVEDKDVHIEQMYKL